MILRLRLRFAIAIALLPFAGCSSGSSPAAVSSGGGTPNPVPSISSVSPPNASAGGSDVTIVVAGTSFVSTSIVNWNGVGLPTSEVSANQLTATVPSANVAAVGAAQITVVNPPPGGGTSNPAGFVIHGTVAAPTPGYAYVANGYDQTISAFSINPSTGGLTAVAGSPFPVPGTRAGGESGPGSLTTDPLDRFLFVANDLSNSSSADDLPAYTIDPSTGALSQLSGSPFTTGSLITPASLSVDSTGKFLYVADDDTTIPSEDNISAYSIDASTGALTPASEAACLVPDGNYPSGYSTSVAADPIAQFLFVTNSLGSICSFSIDPQGGLHPTPGSPVSFKDAYSVGTVGSLAVDPFGRFVYAASNYLDEATPNSVLAFNITPNSGSLTEVHGSPFPTGGSISDPPRALAMDSLGRFLYLANFFDISGFSINPSTGALSMLAGFPISTQVAVPTSLAVDPSGEFLYVVNSAVAYGSSQTGPTVSAYAIDKTTGMLTPVPNSPFAIGGVPAGMTITRKAQ